MSYIKLADRCGFYCRGVSFDFRVVISRVTNAKYIFKHGAGPLEDSKWCEKHDLCARFYVSRPFALFRSSEILILKTCEKDG